MKNFSTWVIVGLALIIVVLAVILIYRPTKEVDQEKIKFRETINNLQGKIDSLKKNIVAPLILKSTQDSIRSAKRDSIHQLQVGRLKRQIRISVYVKLIRNNRMF